MNDDNFPIKFYFIKTFGCQMNYADTERIASVLDSSGLIHVHTMEKADIIVFNTCSVRQSAEDRILGLHHNIFDLKNKKNLQLLSTHYKLPITVLTGCMVRRIWEKKIKEAQKQNQFHLADLRSKLPWIDIILEIRDISQLPKLLKLSQRKSIPSKYINIQPSYETNYRAFVPISTGCNEFCTFCIVPFARGKQEDRNADEIINEINILIKNGYKDITLLGQSVNSWKNPDKKSEVKTFLDLLKIIDSIKGNFWLTFLSSYPNYFTAALIEYIALSSQKGIQTIKNEKILSMGNHIRPYIHCAVQSGSNKILKRMNRKYTSENFKRLCYDCKEKIQNVMLSTDVIVGFPGETEEDFIKTKELFKDIGFDMAYINKFSPRKGTAAGRMKNNVSWSEKEKREKELTKVLAKTARTHNQKELNTKTRMLVDTIKSENGKVYLYGKTFNNKNIKVLNKKNKIVQVGDFIDIIITKASSWHLEGILL